MIVFWTTRGNTDPIAAYLAATMGSAFEKASLLYRYEDWLGPGREHWKRVPEALHVFTDIEFLSGSTQTRAADLHAFLSQRGPVLNHPTRSLKRLALHQLLFSQGINQYRSFAADPIPATKLRFPVFLRRANDHKGSQSPLLTTQDDLAAQLAHLKQRSQSLDDWIITEYSETADATGMRHKFAAFAIGGIIVPRHLFFSESWIIKEAQDLSPSRVEQERAYLEINPHRELLQQVFKLAGIEYGRVDYSLINGKPQIWEINTNPMVFRPSQHWGPRAETHRFVSKQIDQAWQNHAALSAVPGRWSVQKSRTYLDVAEYLCRRLASRVVRKFL